MGQICSSKPPTEKKRTASTKLLLFVSLSLAFAVSLWSGRYCFTSGYGTSTQLSLLSPVESTITTAPKSIQLPALVGNSVFLLNAVWVPSESKLVLLAMTKKMFLGHMDEKYDRLKSRAYNMTFLYESLQPPRTLVEDLTWNNAPIPTCKAIRAAAKDGNIDGRMFILHCPVHSKSNFNELRYKDTVLANFDRDQNKFNAATAMAFDRTPKIDTFKGRAKNATKRLSICIMPVSGYSPLVPDLLDYYRKQGVEHVYYGLIDPTPALLDQYQKAFEEFKGFVSLGWFNSTDVVFDYSRTDGHVLLKIMFSNSALYHAKAFRDDLLMVADLDDVLVSMWPTVSSFVEELSAQINRDTCYGIISPRILWQSDNMTTTKLGERFPRRCKNEGIFEKSVAVLKNGCNFVGIHEHGTCRKGTKVQKVDPTHVTLHHYTAWWGKKRYRCDKRDTEVPSELAIFQRYGFIHNNSHIQNVA